MSETTYTTADGVTLKPGDEFFALSPWADGVRIRRVGKGRSGWSDAIPCVGGSICPRTMAFVSKDAAMRALVTRHENSIADALSQIKRHKSQIKRDQKALAALTQFVN